MTSPGFSLPLRLPRACDGLRCPHEPSGRASLELSILESATRGKDRDRASRKLPHDPVVVAASGESCLHTMTYQHLGPPIFRIAHESSLPHKSEVLQLQQPSSRMSWNAAVLFVVHRTYAGRVWGRSLSHLRRTRRCRRPQSHAPMSTVRVAVQPENRATP